MAFHPPNFTAQQWETLLALSDTICPRLGSSEIEDVKTGVSATVANPPWEAIDRFLETSCRDHADFVGGLHATIAALPGSIVAKIAHILDLLGSEVSTDLNPLGTVFDKLPREEREQLVQSWAKSSSVSLAGAFVAVRDVIISTLLRTSGIAQAALGYPSEHPKELISDAYHRFNFTDLPKSGSAEINYDVIIVGSGSTGGVVAAKLGSYAKENGLKVVLLEKGEWYPQDTFPFPEKSMMKLYQAARSPDGKHAATAGCTWGGGSTVNYSASLETPEYVCAEWADKHGLTFMRSAEYQDCVESVCKRIGVTAENTRHNHANQVILDASKKLGFPCSVVPRNSSGKEHWCGFCGQGCPSGEKLGSAQTWLVDADASDVTFVKNCNVKKILLDDTKVVGVEAFVGEAVMVIKAPKVVMAAGGLNTPQLLLNSGVKNPQIGKNLRLHPGVFCMGLFDGVETNPWDGPILTASCTELENVDGNHYGSKVVIGSTHPGSKGPNFAWNSPVQWRKDVLRFKTSTFQCCLARDRDSSGTITVGPSGDMVMDYNLEPFDEKSLVEGMVLMSQLLVASGADEVRPIVEGIEGYKVVKDGQADILGSPSFKEYIEYLRKQRVTKTLSAHQMGTCRMGSRPENSVTNDKGKVWGYEGLFVSDTSLFPTSIGVNPMVTCMALAEWVVRNMIAEL